MINFYPQTLAIPTDDPPLQIPCDGRPFTQQLVRATGNQLNRSVMKRQRSNERAINDNDYYDEYLKALGKRIKKLRKQKGFTLREMEVIYGHGDSHWRRLERFGAGNIASLINVAKALEISLSTLLAGVEQAACQEDRRKEAG